MERPSDLRRLYEAAHEYAAAIRNGDRAAMDQALRELRRLHRIAAGQVRMGSSVRRVRAA